MKHLFLIIILISFSGFSQTQSAKKDFSTRYKTALDSVRGKINAAYISGSHTTMTVKNLKPGEVLLKELSKTAIKDITLKASSVTKYMYRDNMLKGAQHTTFRITFKNASDAKSAFDRIKETALEKSGIPGLTYTYDSVFRNSNYIYWMNSNCIYNEDEHTNLLYAMQFTNISDDSSDEIFCSCGKVTCEEIGVFAEY